MAKHSSVSDDGVYRHKIKEEDKKEFREEYSKLPKEEVDPLIRDMTSDDDFFKLVPNKRYSTAGIKDEGDYKNLNSKIDPNDKIFDIQEEEENIRYFEESLKSELNELKRLASGEISREGSFKLFLKTFFLFFRIRRSSRIW